MPASRRLNCPASFSDAPCEDPFASPELLVWHLVTAHHWTFRDAAKRPQRMASIAGVVL